jgi:hypothetical protein
MQDCSQLTRQNQYEEPRMNMAQELKRSLQLRKQISISQKGKSDLAF